jgi:hypothetical protein
MAETTITSIVLPNGVAPSGRRRVSMFFAFDLTTMTGGRLEEFPAALDWPSLLTRPDVVYDVTIDGVEGPAAEVVSSAPSPALWTNLFPLDTRVAPSPAAAAERAFVTYPFGRLADYVRSRYQEVARDPSGVPPRAAATYQALRELADLAVDRGDDPAVLDRLLARSAGPARLRVARRGGDREGALAEGPVIYGDELPPGTQRDFLQLSMFLHRPKAARESAPLDQPDPPPDFHEALALLGDHPGVLRQLGIVVDLELSADPAPTAPVTGLIRGRPVWAAPPSEITVQAPHVGFLGGPGIFRTAARPVELAGPNEKQHDGLVVLGGGRWDLVQVDVDGAALKLLATAGSAARSAGDAAEPLPALRSSGFSLVRHDTAGQVHAALATSRDDIAATDLYAEDVTRGYRMDVLDVATGRWRSLHGRRVTYSVEAGPALDSASDEGFVRRTATTPGRDEEGQADTERGPLYVHDALCRWDGWSLAAPHPGKALPIDARAPEPGVPETQPAVVRNVPVPGGVPLGIELSAAPGSLPLLRFGRQYRVRLRTVDLAGNGQTLEGADQVIETDDRFVLPVGAPVTYVRHEPLASPVLVACDSIREGESIAHLAIRSDGEQDATAFGSAHGYGGTCERHVVPPKVSQLFAEQHGAFDSAMGASGDAVAAAYRVARRERGSLADTQVLMADGSVVDQDVTPPAEEDLAGQYVINREKELLVPYLPDPMAGGVLITNVPGVPPGAQLTVSAGGDATMGTSSRPPGRQAAGSTMSGEVMVAYGDPDAWPQVRPFRLALTDGTGPPRWDSQARALVVFLERGARCRITLASTPRADRVDDLALHSWAVDGRPDLADGHRALVEGGHTWTISPALEVELVHACPHPVRPPRVITLAAQRLVGYTYAPLTGQIRVHGESTERLDLVAEWTDSVDDGVAPPRLDVTCAAQVLEFPIDLSRDTSSSPSWHSEAPVVYDEARDLVVLRAPYDGYPRHVFGDTRHRRVRYRAVGASRYREYFEAPASRGPGVRSSASEAFTVSVLSSARPPAPRVRYAVPAYAWTREQQSGTESVSHRGGGLIRVFLDRPWFVSGAGELLGVVLWPGATAAPPAALEGLVTRWGRDPLWEEPSSAGDVMVPLEPAPGLGHFPLAAATKSGLTLPDRENDPASMVAVAGHEVFFDADRDAWACDIEMQTGDTYTPFVRLALSRWQPESLPRCELSSVVLADFAQSAPDRTVTVVRVPTTGGRRLEVSLTGRTYEHGPPGLAPAPDNIGPDIRVRVESRLPGTLDDVGWVDVTGEPGVSVLRDPPSGDRSLLWSGQVEVRGALDGSHRVVVSESEGFMGSGGERRPSFLETVAL